MTTADSHLTSPLFCYRQVRCFPCGWTSKTWGDNPESPAEPYLSNEVSAHCDTDEHRARCTEVGYDPGPQSVTPPGHTGDTPTNEEGR